MGILLSFNDSVINTLMFARAIASFSNIDRSFEYSLSQYLNILSFHMRWIGSWPSCPRTAMLVAVSGTCRIYLR